MQKKEVDAVFSIIIIAMLFFGLVMISSVSVYSSYTITLKQVLKGVLDEPNNSYFMVRTIMYVVMGIVVMTIFSKIPYDFFEKYAKQFFWGSVIFLAAVFIPWVGAEYHGATGWIDLPWLPSIQPVEFAKLSLIIMLAFFLKRRKAMMKDVSMGVIPYFLHAGVVVILLMLQPDFGSILILSPIVLAMYFVGNGNVRFVAIAILVVIVGAVGVYGLGKAFGEQTKLWYISKRVDNFLRSNKDIAQTKNSGNNDDQLRNGFIAIGSGGFWGLGFGASIQKFGYLPEVYGDFIFSVIVEELGFVRGTILIWFYLFIAYRWYNIARSVKDLFWKYVAFGITTWFVVQAFINIGVNLNVIPLTGVTLPFVSYWGSSILSLCMAAGIVLSISRHREVRPQNLSEALQAGRKVVL